VAQELDVAGILVDTAPDEGPRLVQCATTNKGILVDRCASLLSACAASSKLTPCQHHGMLPFA
jgi:hypothetical protein